MRAAGKMTALAALFPSLRDAPGLSPWDPRRLDAWATVAPNEAARHAARFVLGVFDDCEPWACGRFDVLRAVRAWDDEHRRAFAGWAILPWFAVDDT